MFVLVLVLVLGVCEGQPILMGHDGDYCSEDVIYYNTSTCQTCMSRCGMLMDYSSLYCSCDATCMLYGDCCPGFQDHCPLEYTEATNLSSAYTHDLQFVCKKYNLNLRSSKFANFCPANRDACEIMDGPFDHIPVLDLDTGVNFVNAKCAACNGVSRGKVWESTIYCGNDENSTLTSTVTFGNKTEKSMSREELLALVYEGRCSVKVNHQIGLALRICLNYTSTCRECENEELVAACEQGFTQIVHHWFQEDFKNIYCAMCNVPGDGIFCESGITITGERDFYAKYSLALLFDFNPEQQGAVSLRADPEECMPGTEWIGVDIGCKAIECPQGYDLEESQCVSKLEYRKLIVEVDVYLPSMDKLIDEDIDTFSELLANTSAEIIKMAINNTSFVEHFETTFNSSVIENRLRIIITMVLKHQPIEEENRITNELGEMLNLDLLVNDHLRGEAEVWLSNHTSSFILNIGISMTNHSLDQERLLCHQIKFSEDEYVESENKSIKLMNNCLVLFGQYVKINSYIYVCKEYLNCSGQHEEDDSSPGINAITGKLTLSLMSISALCILIRIVLQPLVPAYANCPMKLQFNLCLSMFIAFMLFLVSPLLLEFQVACKIVGILVHWSFLSMFCWITVISRDILLRFKGFGNKQQHKIKGRTLVRYVLLAWGIPLLWVIIAVIVDYVDVNPSYQPHYGVTNCWLNQSWALIIFFGLPFGISLCINISIYIITTWNLRKTFADRKKVLKSEENNLQYSIYVKLFLLMGITWIFAFIAPYVNHISVWIIFICLNASQGIFIFVAFVCNKNVYGSVKKKYFSEDSTSQGTPGHRKYAPYTTVQTLASKSNTPQASPMVSPRNTRVQIDSGHL